MAAKAEFTFGDMIVKPEVRLAGDMLDVLYDKSWISGNHDLVLYSMYRDLGLNMEHRTRIRDYGLRYDVTVIPARMLGVEYVKTKGHYHPDAPGLNVGYPELYYVLEGEAHYLLQRAGSGGLSDVVLVKAGKGDNVLIPPGFGHVTINPSDGELRMANWVCRSFESDYGVYSLNGGAAYFELEGGKFMVNENYGVVPEIRFCGPTNYKDFGLKKGKNPYSLVEDLSALDYLKNPGKHMDLFKLLFKL